MWPALTGVYNNTASESSRFSTVAGVVTDSYTGLRWQAAGSSQMYPWNATAAPGSAQAYCASQSTGDFNDWRLPTVVELQTLVDYLVSSSPTIDVSVFPGTQVDYYWSSTVYPQGSGSAWPVNFEFGVVYYVDIGTAGYCRCVR